MIFVLWGWCSAGANWTQWSLFCDDHVPQVPTGHKDLCFVRMRFFRRQLDTMIFVQWWWFSADAQLDTKIFVLWGWCSADANWTQWSLFCNDNVQQVPIGHNDICFVMMMCSRCQPDTMIFVLWWWWCAAGANWTQRCLFFDDDSQQVPSGHNDLCFVMMMTWKSVTRSFSTKRLLIKRQRKTVKK